MTHENECFWLASIESLGFICEEVSLENIGRNNKDLIFSAIINTIENNIRDPRVVEIGVRALYQAMESTKVYFKEGNGNIIMNAIKKSYEANNDDISVIAT